MKHTALMLVAAALVLIACSEKPQTAGGRRSDAEAWSGAKDPFVAPGWKAGDKASWEEQIRHRSQGQNEYARIAS